MGLIGAIIFAVKVSVMAIHLSWSFALTVSGSVLALLAAILLAAGREPKEPHPARRAHVVMTSAREAVTSHAAPVIMTSGNGPAVAAAAAGHTYATPQSAAVPSAPFQGHGPAQLQV